MNYQDTCDSNKIEILTPDFVVILVECTTVSIFSRQNYCQLILTQIDSERISSDKYLLLTEMVPNFHVFDDELD